MRPLNTCIKFPIPSLIIPPHPVLSYMQGGIRERQTGAHMPLAPLWAPSKKETSGVAKNDKEPPAPVEPKQWI